jgi:hypothetical protein
MTVKDIDGLSLTQNVGSYGTLTMDPTLNLGYEANTYVIPLELHTAVKILVLNVNVGAGADLIFGGTEITIKNTNDAYFTDFTNNYSSTGDVTIDASTPETSPSRFRPKLMAGAGLTVLGVHVNTNLTWYVSDGISAGISAGFVW